MGDRSLTKRNVAAGLLLAALGFTWAVGTASAQGDEASTDTSLLISTAELDSLLDDLTVRIIDIRAPEKFEEGRIPWALNLPAAAILDPRSRISGVRVSDEQLAGMFGQLGIGRDNLVVLYDDKGGHEATRILWLFHYFGHQKVKVLDGGFPRWREEGRHITQQARQVRRELFPIDLTPRRLATAEWILSHMNDPDVLILDVRSPERYLENHIPGAINIFWKEENLNPDDTWKQPEVLRELYRDAGVTEDKNIVVYCQGGNHNGHTYVTLKELGYPQVRSYERAWPEWGSDPTLPKVSGAEPGVAASFQGLGQATAGGPSRAGGDEDDDTVGALEVGLIVGMAVLLVLLGGVGFGLWRLSRRPSVTG